jgi:hypothetical protein
MHSWAIEGRESHGVVDRSALVDGGSIRDDAVERGIKDGIEWHVA